MWLIFILIIAGVVAGIISTVTGMASLISYPMLLAAGLSPVVANVTNTTGLVFAGVSSGISSREELKYNYRDLFWITPLIAIGGIVGSILLLVFPSNVFEKIAPFMILIVAIVFAVQPRLRLDDDVQLDTYVPVKRTWGNCGAHLFNWHLWWLFWSCRWNLYFIGLFRNPRG